MNISINITTALVWAAILFVLGFICGVHSNSDTPTGDE